MDLPPDKARFLRQYDDEKKWDIICDQVRSPSCFHLASDFEGARSSSRSCEYVLVQRMKVSSRFMANVETYVVRVILTLIRC